MAYVAVDKNMTEFIYECKPVRNEKEGNWYVVGANVPYDDEVMLPHGNIKKLIGKSLSWEDEPIELKEAE